MTGEAIGVGLSVLAGLVCLWAGVREARLQVRLSRCGVHAEGVVVDQEQSSSDEPWTPVIAFTDRQGRPVRFQPVATGTGLGLDLGTHVPVVYLPEQPESARVFTRKHRRSSVVLPWAGGVLFLGVAVWAALTR
ncbi:DUF3592 domain-containing protein [Streptomyces luteolifulvus]|jgi:hypothetical protein|uniref:DUF3592 domain-containing protein n=1 Tax=Streptomyces luteolifulvus TaxID=2615112 RepID=A0A6H9V1H2_9ACTN|nr:DUF3592 domain-containing protein [Streptomyces luteolifulvus]KAB1145911.1 DUF3592 domain-containing protein [Streptomyces luteolifulvus]